MIIAAVDGFVVCDSTDDGMNVGLSVDGFGVTKSVGILDGVSVGLPDVGIELSGNAGTAAVGFSDEETPTTGAGAIGGPVGESPPVGTFGALFVGCSVTTNISDGLAVAGGSDGGCSLGENVIMSTTWETSLLMPVADDSFFLVSPTIIPTMDATNITTSMRTTIDHDGRQEHRWAAYGRRRGQPASSSYVTESLSWGGSSAARRTSPPSV